MRKAVIAVVMIFFAGFAMGAVTMQRSATVSLNVPLTHPFAVDFIGRVQTNVCPRVDTELGLTGEDVCDASYDNWTTCVTKHGEEPLRITSDMNIIGNWVRTKE